MDIQLSAYRQYIQFIEYVKWCISKLGLKKDCTLLVKLDWDEENVEEMLRMSLAYAILATLAHQECSGYDLAKRFDESVGYFWSATHQQIYRELSQLEDKAWICSQTIEQSDRPNKKLFSLTPLGRQKMAEWMVQPSKHSKHKEEILVKLFAGPLMEPHQLRAELLRSRASHRQQLETYLIIEQQYFPDPTTLSFADKCQYLTLRQGIRHETNWVEWCDEALSVLALKEV
jgi:DNA-binding PadR family transcriptional regulator